MIRSAATIGEESPGATAKFGPEFDMAWLVGMDEAGYGPNLGPFVMSAVACRFTREQPPSNLWHHLSGAVGRAGDEEKEMPTRLIVDDSKKVHGSPSGWEAFERLAHAILGKHPCQLADLVAHFAGEDRDDLEREPWYSGATSLPTGTMDAPLDECRQAFLRAGEEGGLEAWQARGVIVCPGRFNAIIARHDSKSAVLGHGFIRLLGWALSLPGPGETLHVFVDKQGGRNHYGAQIQQALQEGWVHPVSEKADRSHYRITGLEAPVEITFQPRADDEFFHVACASMLSKYLRELFMAEFNAFWETKVPGLRPTAGYPADAPRYFAAIQEAARALKIEPENLWRNR